MARLLFNGGLIVSVHVSSPTRAHLGLADVVGVSGRRFGGIGCMLAEPRIELVCSLASKGNSLVGRSIDSRLETAVLQALGRLVNAGCAPVKVELLSSIPRHVGLGTGTATVMAALRGAVAAAGQGPDEKVLSDLSGRGGASGVGVFGAWRGGWVVDVGQPMPIPLLPSGEFTPDQPSLVTGHFAAPSWEIDLYFAADSNKVQPVQERALFKAATQDKSSGALRALALLHHGLVPSLVQQDLAAFGSCMERYQSLSLKRHELAAQSDGVRRLARELRGLYPCVGLSSFGPILVGIRADGSSTPAGAPLDQLFRRTRVATSGMVLS